MKAENRPSFRVEIKWNDKFLLHSYSVYSKNRIN